MVDVKQVDRDGLKAAFDSDNVAEKNIALRHAYDVIDCLEARIAELERERDALRLLVYIPGVWRCAKCSFRLVQSNLNAQDGTVTARDETGEKCPNDGAPLWRVTYKDDFADAYERWEEQVNRATAAESRLASYDALVEALRPFAAVSDVCSEPEGWSDSDEMLLVVDNGTGLIDRFRLADFRRAADALKKVGP